MSEKHWRRRRPLLLIAAGLVAVGLAVAAYGTNLLRGPELDVRDAHFSVRGPQRPPRDIVVVAIDDVTFSDLQQQWPFPRRVHARLIARLRADGAKVIAYDVQFTEPTDPADDNALIDAIGRAHNVVLATDEVAANGEVNVLGGADVVREVGARVGDSSVKLDGDGVLRRLWPSLQGLESFPVVVAERASGRKVASSTFGGGGIPVDFAGPPGTITTVSFSRVLEGKVPASAFKGKIVIVGATAPNLQDIHQTAASRSEPMSGPEIHANAVASVLRGLPLRESPAWLDLLIVAALGLAVPLANVRLRSWRIGAFALAVSGGYVCVTQLAFDAGLILPFAYPLLAVLVATISTLGVDYLFTAFERQRVKDVFSRFVPEAVVEDVLARAGEDLRLGGEQRICTVMFCDLRGFTSFSEGLAAGTVIDVVNVYLDQMTDAILAAGGTLTCYMGDGIMAVFGAPLPQADHADRALRAAREMMGPRLARFNSWLQEHDLEGPGFRMGIGLNSGEVMVGNVGSERRVEYTAIGDTTNTASRLEGMTKGTEHMLFMADSTCALLGDRPDDLVCVGEFEVRGRRGTARVWSVPDPATAPPPPRVAASARR